MRITPNHLDILLPFSKHAHFVRDTRRSQPGHPQSQLQDIRPCHGRKVVAVGSGNEGDLLHLWCRRRIVLVVDAKRIHAAVGDQVGVDDGVEEHGVDGVVEVRIHVIVKPFGSLIHISIWI